MKGVYVHIPFCRIHCPYCDFNAYAGMDDLTDQYIHALIREIESAGDGSKVSTIYFGGGTPSRVKPQLLGGLLRKVGEVFYVTPDAEVSIEANPEDVDERYANELITAGFNRISIGVQSLSDRILRMLGRGHDGDRALGAIDAASRAGFERINADLIFGTPGESEGEWRSTIEAVVEAGPNHISCYALTVEEGTPLASWVLTGRFPPTDDDEQADKYEFAERLLEERGFHHYEVSNWAKPMLECRHNLNYWNAGDYLGLGAGAHSHLDGRRSWNVRNPRTYIERSPQVEVGFEALPAERRMEEAAMLGMRTSGGIGRDEFAARWGTDPAIRWRREFGDLADQHLVEVTGDQIRPTKTGFLLNGQIARSIMSLETAVRGT
jgi:oxygen-independent coproporphyrinogen-3 oxidase